MKKDARNVMGADIRSVKVKIYTRTGDKGMTSVYGGKRVEKHKSQVVAYGAVDELNSSLGIIISHLEKDSNSFSFLRKIQSDLFTIGAHLAGSKQELLQIGKRVPQMEEFIDSLDTHLPPLKNFILPGGSREASYAHLARSICRRAEREVIRLSKEHGMVDSRAIMYLNRLSDLLFVLARYLNKKAHQDDIIWKSP